MSGDWDKANQLFKNLGGELRKAGESATKKAATLARDQIKRNITDQVFPWEPLQPATIKRKGSSTILIDKGDYRNSITFKIITPYSAFIGVLRTATRKDTNAPLVNIARIHEFGFMGYVTNGKTGTTYFLRIPQRAAIGPTLEQIKEQLYKDWQTEVAAAIKRSVS